MEVVAGVEAEVVVVVAEAGELFAPSSYSSSEEEVEGEEGGLGLLDLSVLEVLDLGPSEDFESLEAVASLRPSALTAAQTDPSSSSHRRFRISPRFGVAFGA